MKKTWFQHSECTTEQADDLQQQYRARGVSVERSLNPDYLTWTISVRLPESAKPPRIDRRWQNRMWG
ncbi:hypothetical protein YD04_002142 [Salmonella enterica subsp. enterica]|nr:hypothetical protein [Salmonella enterica subsp. enterica]EDU8875904.1 hypothetical protein [Salmonella enterica subsp. enterica]